MIRYGRNNRYHNKFEEEVSFSEQNGFELLQLWFDKYGLCQNENESGNLGIIKTSGHPVIIHALIDIGEFSPLIEDLLPILDELNQTELIIHPVCKSEVIGDDTLFKLTEAICRSEEILRAEGIDIYIENNSQLSPILNSAEELEYLFQSNEKLKFLLDIAHLNDYDHLKKMVEVKYPEILHIADRNLDNIHEHLPIGGGNIDFLYVFRNILKGFRGRIIFELMYPDIDVVNSKRKLEEIIQGV